jgi:hypothetical protein
MRLFALALIALALISPTPARSQQQTEANLVLTILGGTITGHSLWTVDKQLIACDAITCAGQTDTLRISRTITSSMVLGVAATYFPSPHLGFHANVSYVGLPVDSECSGFFNSDPEQKNEQICDNIAAQSANGGAIAMLVGGTVRAASRRTISPYVRGNIGLVNQSRSTVAVAGAYIDAAGRVFERQVIVHQNQHRLTVMFGAALGLTTPLGSGYQLRLETSDLVTSLDRLVGPANALGVGPTASRTYHHFSLTLGFDVVLEKKRGRRY